MFTLKAFGGLSLESDAGSLPTAATQRRRLAFLVLMVGAGEQGITRDKLVLYLWPDSSPEKARHALEQLLYASRRDLGKDAFLQEAGGLRLNPGVVRSDLGEFDAAIKRGDLERAVTLYAAPFLDGVYLNDAPEFERWVDAERARLERCFISALEQLAHGAAARGDLRAAVESWRRLAATDPLSSRIALELMNALVDAGDRAGALQHARIHATLLRQEMEMEPDREVVALAERLRREPETAGLPLPSRPGVPRASVAPEREGRPPRASRRVPRRAVVSATTVLIVLGGAWMLVRGGVASPAAPDSPASIAVLPSAAAGMPVRVRATVGAGTPDPAAHALYLRGRIEWNRRSRKGLQQAVVLFRQATERDPTYAEAYTGLADAYVILGYLGYIPGDAAFPKGKAAALHALALDPSTGEAHAALGVALQWEKRWAEAEQAFLRALEYAPEYATGHQWYALLLTILGRRQEAVMHARHAAELDPLSIQIHNTYGIMLYNVGALDSALRVYERMVTNEPDTAWVRQNPWVLSNFGKVAAAAGRHQDAVRLIGRAAQAVPRHPRPLHALAAAYLEVGDQARARAVFDRADPRHPHYTVYRALLHAQLGDLDATFAWLDRVEEWGPVLLLPLGSDPVLDTLRADPRYPALRNRIGLPEPR